MLPPIVCGGSQCWSLFAYLLLCVLSSFAIILTRKSESVALLHLSFRCLATVNVLCMDLPHGAMGWSDCECGIS